MADEARSDEDESTLRRLVQHYQVLVSRLQSTIDDGEAEDLRADLRSAMEELWPHLQRIVAPLTWSWARSYEADFAGSRGRADVLDALSTSMCMHLLDELATREVRPGAELAPLLRHIAKNRMIDEHRYGQRHAPSRPATASDPGATAAPGFATPVSISAETAERYSEVLSQEFTAQVDDHLFRRQCLEAIEAYWAYRLRPEERLIIRERMNEPPTPHEAIGALLTPPWSAAAVRKRFQRIIDDTRVHLRELGLLSDDLQHGA